MEHLIEKTEDGQFRVVLFSSKYEEKDNLLSMKEIQELANRIAIGVRAPGIRFVFPDKPAEECAKLAGTQLVTGNGNCVKVYGILEPSGSARFPFTQLVEEKKATLYDYRGFPSRSVLRWCVVPMAEKLVNEIKEQ